MGIDAEMFVRTKTPVTDEQVKEWSWRLGEAFGPKKFWIWESDDLSGRRAALQRIEVYEQDGDDIVPEPGETFLQTHPGTRYYGQDYERGDLPFLISLAAFLEQLVPGGDVWYGGDSSGVLAEPFGAEARAELWDHFVQVGHQPYARGFDSLAKPQDGVGWCGFCDHQMPQYGFGPSYAMWRCDGCGAKVERRGEMRIVKLLPGGRLPDTIAARKRAAMNSLPPADRELFWDD